MAPYFAALGFLTLIPWGCAASGATEGANVSDGASIFLCAQAWWLLAIVTGWRDRWAKQQSADRGEP